MAFINKLYFSFRNSFACRLPRFYNFCETKKSVVKFMIAGCIAGGTHLVFLAIFYDLFNWPIVLSTSIAFISAFVTSFSLQKLWTFRDFSQKRAVRQFSLYIINAFFTLNVNGFFMHLLVDRYSIWYLFSQIIVNISLGVYNFFIYRFLVFRKQKNEINCKQEKIRASAGDLA